MNAWKWILPVALPLLAACGAPMLSPAVLVDTIDHARAQAVAEPSDMQQVIHDHFAAQEPGFRILGPTLDRAGASGIVLYDGRVVGHWGDIHRVDMTFGISMGYLSALAGVALREGRIGSLDERVADHFPDLFQGAHEVEITWRELLLQDDPVRADLIAYALLRVFGEPLPAVLKREVMDPIGASDDWQWHGYESSWVGIGGVPMQSVSGAGHYGGGMFISTRDHARFGELMRKRGVWRGRRILPDEWFDAVREPWERNTDRRAIPAAPANAYWASGFGGNYLYIDECNELVIVLRWTPDLRGVVTRALRAMQYHTGCE